MEVEKIEQFLIETKFKNLLLNCLKSLSTIHYFKAARVSMSNNLVLGFERMVRRESLNLGYCGLLDNWIELQGLEGAFSEDNYEIWKKLIQKEGYLGELLTELLGFEVTSSYHSVSQIKITFPKDMTDIQLKESGLWKAFYNLKEKGIL